MYIYIKTDIFFFKEINSTSIPLILDLDDFRLMVLLALRVFCIKEHAIFPII